MKDYIGSRELIRFIESLSPDFSWRVNYQFNRVAIYYRGEIVVSFPFGDIPRHDEKNYKGSLVKRGYQHVLGILFEMARAQEIYLSYEKKKELIKWLENLDYFINPINYKAIESEETRDIKKKKDDLYSKYGVTVGEYKQEEL